MQSHVPGQLRVLRLVPLRKMFSAASIAHLRRLLPLIAMAIGSVILLYVASQYWTMYSEQRHLAREWQRQQQQLDSGATLVDDGLTRLSIRKINLNAVIVEGTNRKALLRGPGHVKDTPAPGELGNSVVTGHRDTFFRHIYELNKGDLVTVQRSGKSFTYEVTGKRVVQPTDTSVLEPSPDARLTLITCYPTYFIGPAPERLVVFTKLADTDRATNEPLTAIPGGAASGVSH
jgi:LPXTG-site transpeptidase (sortase) family protein